VKTRCKRRVLTFFRVFLNGFPPFRMQMTPIQAS